MTSVTSTDPADLSIVVVSYNTRELLAECLRSAVEASSGLATELVVVDNASVDDSAAMVRDDFPQVILIANDENRGFAQAVNQAIAATMGRYVLLLNSDARVLDDGLPSMMGFLDSHPRVGVVGGKLLNPDGRFQSSYADFPDLLQGFLLVSGMARLMRPAYPSYSEATSQTTRKVDWVGGAFCMLRREALQTVGVLDPDYFMYGEEMDLCYRMRERGWQVFYLPDSQAVHRFSASAWRSPEQRRGQVYHSHWVFIRKHRGAMHATAFAWLVRIASLLKMTTWFLRSLSSDRVTREAAQREVASYRIVLARF
jgi:GT2 family glycosyltransferase